MNGDGFEEKGFIFFSSSPSYFEKFISWMDAIKKPNEPAITC